jgi:hypothetical protein
MDCFGQQDHWLRLASVAFACACAAFQRGDMVAHAKARELHRKYSHKYRRVSSSKTGADK